MRRLATLLAVLAVAWSGVVLSTPDSTPDSAESPRVRTRFGRLTSSVWRYGAAFSKHDLAPVPNNNPHPEPQPHRDRPERPVFSASGDRVYVTLAGTEADPGRALAVVDPRTLEVLKRIEVGSRPYVAVLHPGGRFLVVVNEHSNYASVVDTVSDEVTGTIPLDYYCQGLVFTRDGRRAFVANRYLDQVLVVDIEVKAQQLSGRVRTVGGFDEAAFFGREEVAPELARELERRGLTEAAAASKTRHSGINGILRARCGRCHSSPTGGFVAGPDPVENFLSAVENSVGGRPSASPLVAAVSPASAGGFGDRRTTPQFHAGGALLHPGEPERDRIVGWIRDAADGPGITVGNPGSHPKDVALSADGRHLFVGNTGTQDVSVIDTETLREVGAIFVQNVASHVALVPDPAPVGSDARDQLLVLTMGVGFGTPKARDPAGAETWDRGHAAAQFALLRDPETTDPLPLEKQPVLGPFDAIDGTWASKMRDIQNDVVAVDLSRLDVPEAAGGTDLRYLLRASRYEAHPGWVRYTSDTAEATVGDVKGDIPPELQRVVGAFPEWAAVDGDRIFVTMSGSAELVEWRVDPRAADASARLAPVAVYPTGLRPVGVAASADHIAVANRLSETLTVIDRATGATSDVVVGDLTRPALDTDAEKGELVVHTAHFSSDGDTSCLHCHYRDTGDGRGWGAAETVGQDRTGHLTHGGTLGIPQMRNIFAIQPYYFEGTHRLSEGQGADINEPASSIDFAEPVVAGDYRGIESPIPPDDRRLMHEELKERVEVRKLGDEWYTLEERRDAFIQEQSLRYFGAAYGLSDLYRFVGAWLGNTTHLVPNPFDAENPAVVRGERIFNDPKVMCGVCHRAPEFTDKGDELTHNDRKALPPLTTITRRDASYTLVSVRAMEVANGVEHIDLAPDDRGRVEDVEGTFTTMQLRGLFDRPPNFLHHGRARSLREVLATPGHPALRRFRLPVLQGPEDVRPYRMEVGLNETTRRTAAGPLDPTDVTIDTHGGTSHLGPRALDDLLAFVLSIE